VLLVNKKRRGEARSGRVQARSIHQERERDDGPRLSLVAPLQPLRFLPHFLVSRSERPTRLQPSQEMDSLPDATLFQLVSSSALQGLLDKIVGPKTLVLSPSLAGPLGLVTEVGLLKVRPLFCSTSIEPES
jgi:hypothetical protein